MCSGSTSLRKAKVNPLKLTEDFAFPLFHQLGAGAQHSSGWWDEHCCMGTKGFQVDEDERRTGWWALISETRKLSRRVIWVLLSATNPSFNFCAYRDASVPEEKVAISGSLLSGVAGPWTQDSVISGGQPEPAQQTAWRGPTAPAAVNVPHTAGEIVVL